MSVDYQKNIPAYQPYSSGTPSSGGGSGKTVLIIVGIVSGLVVVSCACCIGGGVALTMFGFNVLEQEARAAVEHNEVFREHIGNIQSLDVNFVKSSAHGDPDVMVYDVRGDRGSGELLISSTEEFDGSSEIHWIELKLPSGETIELD